MFLNICYRPNTYHITGGNTMITRKSIAAMIDHTLLKQNATEEQIDKLAAGQSGSETPSTPATPAEVPKFVVVKVDAGKSLIGSASAEIILRSGTATAIAGASGGVSDLTGGTDLSTGTDVSKNHLLIIPADDGRGIRCTTTCYVMVKGDYKLQ